ncbi:YciI family protein [Lentimicrobium sp. S6]|uniref:YciI family protein n=1 Tax=Lentimicrobium sp. S6 TaxID=2735872 RepID=UPI00155825B4|nr:YciI family protein [Lentimicrobium sp. S6]NPD44773.1 hypothetical protein [Lentimicrobium sp. S6]
MKKTIKTLLILSITTLFAACQPNVEINTNTLDKVDLTFDSIKAIEYGADDYGMKKYVMAFLKRGTNQSLSKDSSNALQMAHMQNIDLMAEQGRLVLAGPFFGDQDLRGIYIFNVESIEEAKELTNTDPAIEAGVLQMELMEWYGSAALMGVNDVHNSLTKKSFTD